MGNRTITLKINLCKDCPYVDIVMLDLECTHPDLPEGTIVIENINEIPDWCPLLD